MCKYFAPDVNDCGINIDGLALSDVERFVELTNYAYPVIMARVLFPLQPYGYVKATRILHKYATQKAYAMRARLNGNINTAINYERACESLYRQLPEFAKL